MMQEEQPLQVARCTKIINPGTDEAKYVINVKQIAKFVVGLGDKVRPGQQRTWTHAQQQAELKAAATAFTVAEGTCPAAWFLQGSLCTVLLQQCERTWWQQTSTIACATAAVV
jgi:hypothetical protein